MRDAHMAIDAGLAVFRSPVCIDAMHINRHPAHIVGRRIIVDSAMAIPAGFGVSGAKEAPGDFSPLHAVFVKILLSIEAGRREETPQVWRNRDFFLQVGERLIGQVAVSTLYDDASRVVAVRRSQHFVAQRVIAMAGHAEVVSAGGMQRDLASPEGNRTQGAANDDQSEYGKSRTGFEDGSPIHVSQILCVNPTRGREYVDVGPALSGSALVE